MTKENFDQTNASLELAVKYLYSSSEKYPAVYIYRAYNFIRMMNFSLEKNNHDILPMLHRHSAIQEKPPHIQKKP